MPNAMLTWERSDTEDELLCTMKYTNKDNSRCVAFDDSSIYRLQERLWLGEAYRASSTTIFVNCHKGTYNSCVL